MPVNVFIILDGIDFVICHGNRTLSLHDKLFNGVDPLIVLCVSQSVAFASFK
ncbi:hypothetical protein IKMOJFFE_00193 [Vaccinia virus]|uniref:Uncharacterized protein n=1 Tax=Vaccinia virus TaxID=10245 RepID=A0A7G4P1Z7_VACCV|nr:hypothetical protein IKMOJFFE_00004 [Vaccinia virus]QMT29648.1 hypothetical protein IKMOJFFE_00193 [Vaccinia virus]